jgi:hypothetical protein
MGYTTAQELASILDLESSIAMHLTANHYPPVPTSMVQPCIDAIDAYHDEDFNREIEMPKGVSYKGKTTAPAWAIVEQHHLDAWLPHSWDCDCSDCIVAMEEDAGFEGWLGLE